MVVTGTEAGIDTRYVGLNACAACGRLMINSKSFNEFDE
jgi:hypothetical protein